MSPSSVPAVHVSEEVRAALDERRAVVALESTIIVQGLPAPMNLEVADACEAAVRAAGAVPATAGVLAGRAILGLARRDVESLADPARHAAKLSARDLGLATAQGVWGATTVAGTIALAHRVGVSVMATGGLGGVHQGASQSFDESADLTALSRTPVLVVASGVKSILDIPATLERLDSLGVPVVGYRTRHFPGFYLEDSGVALDWSLDDPASVAAAFDHHRAVSPTGFLLANPVAPASALSRDLHDRALAAAHEAVRAEGATGKAVTPIMLAAFARVTAGESVRTNRDLVIANAALAGRVAVALASTFA